MRGWNKGVVWVNGHNLGKYWNIGPQQTLYVPGCWLNKGKNELIIFEQMYDGQTQISTINSPILDQLNFDVDK
jgi:beta-galactosidase